MGKKSVCGALGSLSLPDHISFFIPKWHKSSTEPRPFFPTPFLACPGPLWNHLTVNPTLCQLETHRHINTSLGSYLVALLSPKAVYVLGLERPVFCIMLAVQGGRDKGSL